MDNKVSEPVQKVRDDIKGPVIHMSRYGADYVLTVLEVGPK
jgi:hypothetical protein